jgi:Zn-dependent protease
MGKIVGIDFRIHVTFFLLLIFIYVSALSQYGPKSAFMAVLFICAIFACVLIHEIGHSLIARRFGKEAKSITLLPIGGVATMEEMPEKPQQEIVMSIAGPLINLAIAGILFLFVSQWQGIRVLTMYPDSLSAFISELISVNIILAVFNLIPAFPMDGGRVLRGILALKMDYIQATSLAVSIGQGMSLFFIFFGLLFNIWITLIGVFIYIGAGSEKHEVMLRAVLRKVPASAVMTTNFQTLQPDKSLSQVLEYVYHGCQDDFPVMGDSGIQGILTRKDILSAIHEKGINIMISDVMDRDFFSVKPDESLDKVYHHLLNKHKTAAAVLEGGRLMGMICLDSISRYFMIQNAMVSKEDTVPLLKGSL